MQRLGVFRLGQFWSVMGETGAQLAFPERHGAIEAARNILRAHHARGEDVELVVQDELGELSAWNHAASATDQVLRMKPRSVRLRLVD